MAREKMNRTTPLLDARSQHIGKFIELKKNIKNVLINVAAFQKTAEDLVAQMELDGSGETEIAEVQKLADWFKEVGEI